MSTNRYWNERIDLSKQPTAEEGDLITCRRCGNHSVRLFSSPETGDSVLYWVCSGEVGIGGINGRLLPPLPEGEADE